MPIPAWLSRYKKKNTIRGSFSMAEQGRALVSENALQRRAPQKFLCPWRCVAEDASAGMSIVPFLACLLLRHEKAYAAVKEKYGRICSKRDATVPLRPGTVPLLEKSFLKSCTFRPAWYKMNVKVDNGVSLCRRTDVSAIAVHGTCKKAVLRPSGAEPRNTNPKVGRGG